MWQNVAQSVEPHNIITVSNSSYRRSCQSHIQNISNISFHFFKLAFMDLSKALESWPMNHRPAEGSRISDLIEQDLMSSCYQKKVVTSPFDDHSIQIYQSATSTKHSPKILFTPTIA